MIDKDRIPQDRVGELAHLNGMTHACSDLIGDMLEIIESGQVLTGDDCIALINNKIEEINKFIEGDGDED